MAHEFEVREEIELDASPEVVWEAISTGPGVDSWFMGRTEIESRLGGKVRWTMGGETSEATVTAWEPGRRYATRVEPGPDGTFMAFEYLIEGREGGSTVLRFVHNGFLGDNWEAEYDALRKGDRIYLEKLAIYVKHFAPRTATYEMFAPGPQAPADHAWTTIRSALGLAHEPAEGDKVRLAVGGLPPAEGVVEFARLPTAIGVRTGDGFYAFLHAMETVVVEHHAFGDVDGPAIERAWQSWLQTAF